TVPPDRKGRAGALGRRDWKPDANRARDSRAVDSRAEHENVGVQRVASVESGGSHLAAPLVQLHDAPAEDELRAHPLAGGLQLPRELDAVTAGIGDPVDGAGELVLDRGEKRLSLGHAFGVEHVLLLAVVLDELHLLDARLETLRVAVQIEDPRMDVVV